MPGNNGSSSNDNNNGGNNNNIFSDGPRDSVPLKPKSRSQTAKEGWGDRRQFQHSYGLGMDPDAIEEGNAILDAMREGEYVVDKQQQKREQADAGKKK